MRVIEQLVEEISHLDAKHAKKLKRELKERDEEFFLHADRFYDAFMDFWKNQEIPMDHVASCYVKMREDMNELYKDFVKHEQYLDRFGWCDLRVFYWLWPRLTGFNGQYIGGFPPPHQSPQAGP